MKNMQMQGEIAICDQNTAISLIYREAKEIENPVTSLRLFTRKNRLPWKWQSAAETPMTNGFFLHPAQIFLFVTKEKKYI